MKKKQSKGRIVRKRRTALQALQSKLIRNVAKKEAELDQALKAIDGLDEVIRAIKEMH